MAKQVVAIRAEAEDIKRWRTEAGEASLSAWLRGLANGACTRDDGGPRGSAASVMVKSSVDLGMHHKPVAEVKKEESGAEDAQEKPEDATRRCPRCKVHTASGDLCTDCVIEEETEGGAFE